MSYAVYRSNVQMEPRNSKSYMSAQEHFDHSNSREHTFVQPQFLVSQMDHKRISTQSKMCTGQQNSF